MGSIFFADIFGWLLLDYICELVVPNTRFIKLFVVTKSMEHLAIMKKSWGLIPKILSGEKTIESRWYKNKYPPWNKIQEGELVYFKNSGEPVTLKAGIKKVIQISDLTPGKVQEILDKYAKADGIMQEKNEFFKIFQNKNYCILIFLKNPQKIEPFEINKKGFGLMSAWISVDNINIIKKT